MDRDDGTVHGHGVDLHAEDRRVVHRCTYAIQHPALRPTIHARIDGVPVAEPLGQAAPWAPLLGDVHDGVQHVQIVERHVAAWRRQIQLELAILCVGDFQVRRIS